MAAGSSEAPYDRSFGEERWSQVLREHADQVQVSVDTAVAALDPDRWEFVVAEDRPRAVAGSRVDAVIRARRLS